MGTWALIQIVFNIFLALGLFVVIMRMSRAPKDDPRLSRGLQLLQSKISVLEDLSDRTEVQVNQLTAILDQKCREVQAKVQLAEQHVHLIRVSMDRSLEVAKIFQDKIPHQEIIERQNTIKYVQAARLAHQGLNAEEIAQKVDLPKGEIEFIAKVNRDQLMFSEDQLPWWAKANADKTIVEDGEAPDMEVVAASQVPQMTQDQQATQTARLKAEMEIAERQKLVENLSKIQSEMQNLDLQLARESAVRDMAAAFEVPQVPTQSLQKLGEEFRKACEAANAQPKGNSLFPPIEQLSSLIPQALFTQVDDGSSVPTIFGLGPSNMPMMGVAPSAQQPPSSAANEAQPTSPQAEAPSVGPSANQQSEKPRDPVLARAAAEAKVRAALNAGAKNQPESAPASALAKEVNPELEAARALAREVAAAQGPVPAHQANPIQPVPMAGAPQAQPPSTAEQAGAQAQQQPSAGAQVQRPQSTTKQHVVVNGRTSTGPEPIIQRVVFPKIEAP